jgi:hypothetical protein
VILSSQSTKLTHKRGSSEVFSSPSSPVCGFEPIFIQMPSSCVTSLTPRHITICLGDTDMGGKKPKNILSKGIFYGHIEPL